MEQIQIKAEVDRQDVNTCRFTVDREIEKGKSSFLTQDEAKKNQLADKLFKLGTINKVELDNNIVTIRKHGEEDWRVVGKRVGALIRSYLQPPAEGKLPTDEVKQKVQEVLDIQVNPGVASHGGFVQLINIEDDIVYLKMGGGCQGCGAADMTLKMGIERMIRDAVPQIVQVLDVTDHASGSNPYYSPSK
jgi:NFU1 iron-sulfur cluster scaffold homolog, mitochondrial